MSITEARSTPKFVCFIKIEVPWFARVALFPFHVLLADTNAVHGVTTGSVFETSSHVATAWLTSLRKFIYNFDIQQVRSKL